MTRKVALITGVTGQDGAYLAEWVAESERIKGVTFHPVSNSIALQSVNLPGAFHPDPADRILVATARQLGATLVTGDAKIHRYPHVKTLW